MKHRENRGLRRGRFEWTVMALSVSAVGMLALSGAITAGAFRPVSSTISHGPVSGPCSVGTEPTFPGFDPVNHDVYVPNSLSSNITVLSATCVKVGTITLPFGSIPYAAAFDPANNEMYVTDIGLPGVYAISGTTVVSTITSSSFVAPAQLVWDPGDNLMLVADSYANAVIAISGSTVIGSVAVGSYPYGICYDPYYNVIVVANQASTNVTLLNAYSPLASALANINVSYGPTGCAFDIANHEDYILNGNQVTVMTGTGYVLANIPVGKYPKGIAWDQAKLAVYVTNGNAGTISVISGTSVVKTIKGVATTPYGLTYDEVNDRMYVAAFGSNVVYIVA
ncbi:MAG: YncE family protein [Candidatus Lutacidiplasmatales archaeon]